ncbi:MAG: hypothetical protein U0528_09350 [Anaerolineae bacterium]|nr:hypothetical protein [Anaerolineae bacterium]
MEHVPGENPTRPNQLLGVLLIVIGGLFLFSQLFGFSLWRVAWPFFILIPGIVLVLLGLALGTSGLILTIVGMIVAVTGLILGYQSITGNWASWSYLWSLIAPTAVGLALMLHGYVTHQPRLIESGRRVSVVGLVILVIGWVFFELLLGLNGFGNPALVRTFGPLLLIAFGIYLLWRRNQTLQH